MVFEKGHWIGTNTDIDGFKKLAETFKQRNDIVVWGGGGTLKVIEEILPQASFYSVRNQEPRFGSKASDKPQVVIWAANPSADLPLMDWHPEIVVDLNYSEDSLAREYAFQVNAKYISGLVMFAEQAQKQREFWSLKR